MNGKPTALLEFLRGNRVPDPPKKSVKRSILYFLCASVLMGLAAVGVLMGSGMSDEIGVADLALVLGNKVHPDGTPSPRLKARLDAATELYHGGYFKKILVSGATGQEGVPEGTAMKRYLVQAGIPEAVILVDDEGVDTWESAAYTAAILRSEKADSVFVITQYFHIPRTQLALRKFGVSRQFHVHPRYFEARDLYSILRELPAYLAYLSRSPAHEMEGSSATN
jgi:vancomycin permeability regulator SanA